MAPAVITLDVRDDIRAGREPFARIMDAVGRLRDGEQLRILAPFEPRPLISLLCRQGFASVMKAVEDGYEVIFTAEKSGDDSLL